MIVLDPKHYKTKSKLPIHADTLSQKRRKLTLRQKLLQTLPIASEHFPNKFRQTMATFTTTSSPDNHQKSKLSRTKSSSQPRCIAVAWNLRPYTQVHKNGRKVLGIIETMNSDSQSYGKHNNSRSFINQKKIFRRQEKNGFLCKKMGMDKAVINGVLRSKFNCCVKHCNESIGSYVGNGALVQRTKLLIPPALKDVIGVQELLRMQNVYAGNHYKTVNLDHEVAVYLQKRCKKKQTEQTVRSIKRW